jgi:maleylacetoacetate isomerase
VQPSLVLHGYWRSSSAYRVRIALELKGLRYRNEHVNLLAGEQRSDAHRARNPSGYVPALEVEGTTLVESVAILEWIEEAFPTPPLLPHALLDRAHVRALVETINAGTQPLQNLWVLNHFFGPDAEGKATWARQVIARGLSAFEEHVARHRGATGDSGPYCFGAAPTLADVMLVPQLYNARRFQVDLTPYPHVTAIDAACAKLDAFARAHPDVQPDAKP